MNILENTLQQLHSRAPHFYYRSHDDEEIAIHYDKLLQSISYWDPDTEGSAHQNSLSTQADETFHCINKWELTLRMR